MINAVICTWTFGEPSRQLGQGALELALQRIGRVCHDQPATVEAVGSTCAPDHELDTQQVGP